MIHASYYELKLAPEVLGRILFVQQVVHCFHIQPIIYIMHMLQRRSHVKPLERLTAKHIYKQLPRGVLAPKISEGGFSRQVSLRSKISVTKML